MNVGLRTLAEALGGEVSNGQVLAPGPGHSSADRSLSVKLDSAAPGGFVCHSFSGDDLGKCRDHVRAALGLPPWKPNGGNQTRSSIDIEKAIAAALVAQTRTTKPARCIVKTYDYTTADGTLLYQNVRFEPKNFVQRRPSPDEPNVWIWGLGAGEYMRKGPGRNWSKFNEQKFAEGKYIERRTFDGVQRVIYRLPDFIKYPDGTAFICEGELDCDRVAELGHCATTVASGKWTKDCIEALAGRDVLLLEDNDEPGRKKAIEAATALHGMAKSIRIVRLPGLPDKGDVSDWLDMGHTVTNSPPSAWPRQYGSRTPIPSRTPAPSSRTSSRNRRTPAHRRSLPAACRTWKRSQSIGYGTGASRAARLP
jgi:hypothetical protein